MEVSENTPVPERSRNRAAIALIPAALLVILMWSAYFLDVGFDLDLYRFGTLPRTLTGLRGVLLSPFIHGDFEHLLNNSIPMLVLGWALYYFFPRVALQVVFGAWVVSGFWVWLSARGNFHIGASGVVYGLAAFLFTSGLLRKQRTLMGLSLLVVFLYGSLLWGMFPIFPKISWESHFWGAVSGVAMAFLYRQVPAAVNDPKPIVWDDEEDEQSPIDAPVIEEQRAVQTWSSTNSWDLPAENKEPR